MKDIQFEGTSKTPAVAFTSDPLEISLSGRSIPENSIEFYRPLIAWVDENCQEEASELQVNIKLEYFNTSSSKCLMDLLKRLESAPVKARVNWYHEEEDEDMLEAGEDYDAIVDLPFRLIATKD
jgi:hypothetical protein